MGIPKGAKTISREFARSIVRRKWAEMRPLCSTALQAQRSVDELATEFGWDQLGPRIRQLEADRTGEPIEAVPLYDPPRRFEVFEVEERDPPPGHDPAVRVGWVEVDFAPAEDSEFDYCYNCFLAIIDEDGPKISAYVIESATE